jgi:hypothetical protein
MVEFHTNFTVNGSKTVVDGVQPTNHAIHETIEITQGFNDWFETGLYIFTSARSGDGWDWVGDHIRPRFRVLPEWHWPVGVSLSNEIGYQRTLLAGYIGPGRCARSSTRSWDAGIFRSIPPLTSSA